MCWPQYNAIVCHIKKKKERKEKSLPSFFNNSVKRPLIRPQQGEKPVGFRACVRQVAEQGSWPNVIRWLVAHKRLSM